MPAPTHSRAFFDARDSCLRSDAALDSLYEVAV